MSTHIEQLQAHGFGVVMDGDAVIVISKNGQQDTPMTASCNSRTIARRYVSAKQAVKILIGENNLHNDNYLLDTGK